MFSKGFLSLAILLAICGTSTAFFLEVPQYEIDLHLTNRDNSTFIGILGNTAEDLLEVFINASVRGLLEPFRSANELQRILLSKYPTFSDQFSAVVELFVDKAKNGAVMYFKFISSLARIIWAMFDNTLALWGLNVPLLN